MRNLVTYFVIVLVAIIGTLCGCSQQSSSSKPTFDEKKFVELYVEALLLQKSSLPPNERKQKLQALFSHYRFTPEKYQQIRHYYEQHPEEWERVLTKAIAQLKKQRQIVSQKKQAQ
ncbi:hypothetical protein DRQ15_05370 [candidate division KSB1 bacterium]|nr:MAG: hypothetical protein DRQ15_05370 [candidate division KSB1 bacterium]